MMNRNILLDVTINKINTVFTIHTEKNKTAKRINRLRWAIVLKYEGETVYTTSQGEKITSNLKNIVILPKGSSYQWQCTKAGRYYTVEFESDLTCDTIFSCPIENGEKILQLYKETERNFLLKRDTCKLEILKNVYSILLAILQPNKQKYTPSNKQEKIQPAIDYIFSHYNLPMKNDNLAKLTGLSTIYFRRLFTEVFGVSPIAYVHKLRIKKAKEMLKSDYGSIEEIALALGYANLFDFSRTFKKHTGLSPTNYIKEKNLLLT